MNQDGVDKLAIVLELVCNGEGRKGKMERGRERESKKGGNGRFFIP